MTTQLLCLFAFYGPVDIVVIIVPTHAEVQGKFIFIFGTALTRMTCSDISTIFITVAITQLLCDLLARHFIFSSESYVRAKARLERLEVQCDKLTSTSSKKGQRLIVDRTEARSQLAKKHTAPQIGTSLVFVVLYRILAAEHAGNVMGVMPFLPLSFLQRLTARGIDFGDQHPAGQGCAFVFLYILSTLTVKFYVHQAMSIHPPKGADGGLLTMMEDSNSQRLLKAWGLDNETLDK